MFRQLLAQEITHGVSLQFHTAFGNYISHQAFLAGCIFSHDYDAGINSRVFSQLGLDFAEFHTLTLQLDLEIFAPQEFDISIRQILSPVAGTVESLPIAAPMDETGSGFRGIPPIAPG